VADSISGSVAVVTLEVHHVGFGIFEGIFHQTTLATVVTVGLGAVHKLLLREALEVAGLLEISTFHGSDGGESPAGTTLCLVLNRGDSTGISPVLCTNEVGFIKLDNVQLLLLSDETTGILSFKFFIGQVSEWRDPESESMLTTLIEVLDELDIVVEDSESVFVFSTFIGFLKLDLELFKGSSDVVWDEVNLKVRFSSKEAIRSSVKTDTYNSFIHDINAFGSGWALS